MYICSYCYFKRNKYVEKMYIFYIIVCQKESFRKELWKKKSTHFYQSGKKKKKLLKRVYLSEYKNSCLAVLQNRKANKS